MSFIDDILGINSPKTHVSGCYKRRVYPVKDLEVDMTQFIVTKIEREGIEPYYKIVDDDTNMITYSTANCLPTLLSAIEELMNTRVYRPEKYDFITKVKLEKLFCLDNLYRREMERAKRTLNIDYIVGSAENKQLLEDIVVNTINSFINF